LSRTKLSTGKKSRTPGKRSGSSQKLAHSLVALSSAAVLAVYTAGYLRTRSAAERFVVDGAQRRTAGPAETSPMALPAAPERSFDASSPPSVSTTPAVPAFPAPKDDADGPPRPNRSPQLSSEPAVASTPAPATESTDGSLIPLPAAPTAPATAIPVTTDADIRTTEPPSAPQSQYKDGTYSGWGTSRHGDIQATVVVDGGRIASAVITQCLTRYSCSVVSMLPPQVAIRQSADVDYVSGATQSSNAFYYAVLEALSRAK
jgi:uncharacterized protein with FMN-binding domain